MNVAAIGGPHAPGTPPAWNTYTAVESIDRAATRVREAGGTVVAEPKDIPDAGRMAVFADDQGAVFSPWEADPFIGAQLVNEPGTWNFSELHTADPAAAARFYGAEAERLGGKVLVPPFDSEPVRMTVLADPQGAVFTASKFQPREP